MDHLIERVTEEVKNRLLAQGLKDHKSSILKQPITFTMPPKAKEEKKEEASYDGLFLICLHSMKKPRDINFFLGFITYFPLCPKNFTFLFL